MPFSIIKCIVDAKAQFCSIAEPWADTGTSTGRLMLAVLGGLAHVERDLIRTRTAEDRSRAKAQRKHMGLPPFLTPAHQKEATEPRDGLVSAYSVAACRFRLRRACAGVSAAARVRPRPSCFAIAERCSE